MKTISSPISSYNLNTDSPDKRWREDINNQMKDMTRKPRNMNAVSSQTISSRNFKDFPIYQGGAFDYENVKGFFFPSSGDVFIIDGILYKPSNFKLALINDITLDLAINYSSVNTGGYFGAPATDFSIDCYLPLLMFKTNQMNLVPLYQGEFDFDAQFICPKFTLSFTVADPLGWTSDRFKYSLKLSDTVDRFRDGNGQPTFTDADRNKITPAQFKSLTENDFLVQSSFGYDRDQYNALSVANRDFLFDLFVDAGAGSPVFDLSNIELTFTHYGVGASYQPIVS